MKKKELGDGRRVSRVEREVQMSIAQFLLSGFKHPLPGLVTISHVKMPGDLRTAKVYVSVLGSDQQKHEVIETLNQRAFQVQDFIGRELKMRFCPKLTFYADETTEKVLKIEKILADLKDENQRQGVSINLQPKMDLVKGSDEDTD